MPDVFTKKKRSEVMSLIRSRGNKNTELRLMAIFRAQRITGWRRQIAIGLCEQATSNAEHRTLKKRPSKGAVQSSMLNVQRSMFASRRVRPDFVFRKLRAAVFVDGCFWHACPLHTTKPKGNAAYWRNKFAANKARDQLVTRALRRSGWRVLRIWEHELTRKNEARLVCRLRRFFDA